MHKTKLIPAIKANNGAVFLKKVHILPHLMIVLATGNPNV
jgi:hypothetical protein